MNSCNHHKKKDALSKNAVKNYVLGIFIMILFLFAQSLFAQVGIGTTIPDSSATLDITSTDGGILIPRISLIDVTNITTPINNPATGLLIYNTNASVVGGNNEGFYYFNGTRWIKFSIIDGSISTNLKDIAIISAFPGLTYPNDMYLPLDGSTYNNVDYPEFAAIITNLDSDVVTDNGNGTFTLTNWNNNGVFLRGQGGNAATIGALQNDATSQPNNAFSTESTSISTNVTGNHNHAYTRPRSAFSPSLESGSSRTGRSTESATTGSAGNHSHTVNIPSLIIDTGGDVETRPINRSITWVIKVKPSASSVNNLTINNYTDIGTDNQTISISGNTLTIEDGNSVTLPDTNTTYDGTDFTLSNQTLPAGQVVTGISATGMLIGSIPTDYDNQNIQGSGLSGTNLTIGIQNGSSQVVDLSSLQDGTGTDNQNLSLSGSTLSIEDGNSVNLNAINTDNQNIQGSSLSGTDLTIGIQNGTSQVVDLSSLQDGTGTDNQDLYISGSTLGITGGNNVSISSINTDNQTIDDFSFDLPTGILTLEIEDDGITPQTVDLSALYNADLDWVREGTFFSSPDNVNDNMYTQGRVGIGNMSPQATFDVDYIGTDTKAAIIDFSTLSNAMTSIPSDIPSGLTVNTIANSANRQLYSGFFTMSGMMSGGSAISSGGIGIFNDIITSGETQGLSILVDAESNISYGIDLSVTSSPSTENYGIRNIVSGASSVNYGTYSNAIGATTNWAGYFGGAGSGSGNVYIQDNLEVDGTINYTDGNEAAGFILESDATGNASWVDPTTLFNDEIDWYEVGTTTKPNAITDDIYTQGNVAIGKSSATYKLDIETLVDSRAINTRIGGTTTGTIYGQYIQNDNSEDGAHYGTSNHLFGDGDGMHFGVANHLYGTGDGHRVGVYNDLAPLGTQDKTGVLNSIRLSTATNNADAYGMQSTLVEAITGSLGDFYGIHNTAIGNGDGARYGMFNILGGIGDGERYGSRSNISGSGTGAKYGTYNSISSSAGGTHYGVYSDVAKANSYAGYFLGRFSIGTTTANNYILPASRGTNGQVMTTDGAGNVTWQTPATDESTTASNGLTEIGDNIQLGGTLTQDTSINYGNFDTRFNLTGTGDFIIQDAFNDRFIVGDNGNVGIGTSAPDRDLTVVHGTNGPNNGFKLQNANVSNRFFKFFVSQSTTNPRLLLYSDVSGESTSIGEFDATSGVYTATSDRRLKKDFKSLYFDWTNFMNLETLTYRYKKDPSDKSYIGLIAQDVEKIYPELVNYVEDDDVYHMDYSGFGVITIKAIQELKQEVDALKKENAVLKAKLYKIELLEARLTALENNRNNLETSVSIED